MNNSFFKKTIITLSLLLIGGSGFIFANNISQSTFLFALKHDPLVSRPKSVDIICPKSFKELFNKLIEIYGKWVLDDSIQINNQDIYQNSNQIINQIIYFFFCSYNYSIIF